MPVSVALNRLLADGSVILLAGTTEVGQGSRTILSQIVAQELSISIDQVTLRGTDTMATPFDCSTGARRSTTVMGSAVNAAAEDLRRQLIQAAAEAFHTTTITLRDGKGCSGDKYLNYGQVINNYFGMPGGELIGRSYMRPDGTLGRTFPLFWETGMGGAEISVDEETGKIKVERYRTVADVGKALNPQLA